MPEQLEEEEGGVSYRAVDSGYFEKRTLRKHARVWSLWALGVGAVISGHFSGWNLGLGQGGFGGLLFATAVIMVMYLGLCFSIAEMSPALPHTGGAYSFSRTALGPWGGFVTGLAENIEFVLTPAVIVFFIGAYLGNIFGTPVAFAPVWWLLCYALFVGLNLIGVEVSFRFSVFITLLALSILAIFYVFATPHFSLDQALNIGGKTADGKLFAAPAGTAQWLPFGWAGALACLPFAVWFFLAIEQLPLAAEESHDPKRDMPRGLISGILTLIVSAFLVLFLNSGVAGGAAAIGASGSPLLDGFKAIFTGPWAWLASALSLMAVAGLIASFHTIIFAYGRQIYSLSRAGYFPTVLSVTHGTRKVPHVALITGAVMGYVVMLIVWFGVGATRAEGFVGGTLLNMAVFGAMISYAMQALAFIFLRANLPHIERPFRSPFGVPGAVLTLLIALLTLYFQFADETYRHGVIGAAIWYTVWLAYFALVGRKRLVRSPEEEFAVRERARGVAAKASLT
ncbi:amino acid permease [Hyalangium sp.]|uniref:amino acid permease n=1 Tax=Hyalangium sp. TaxID=2028555 RepID=UPI002D345DE3|nr:amino acid permease [Hyalangium sp.]HYI00283.1 amino acid permease [Hyalangium sp.]